MERPLGGFGKIGAIFGAIIGELRPITVPATPWVRPKIGQVIAGRSPSHIY